MKKALILIGLLMLIFLMKPTSAQLGYNFGASNGTDTLTPPAFFGLTIIPTVDINLTSVLNRTSADTLRIIDQNNATILSSATIVGGNFTAGIRLNRGQIYRIELNITCSTCSLITNYAHRLPLEINGIRIVNTSENAYNTSTANLINPTAITYSIIQNESETNLINPSNLASIITSNITFSANHSSFLGYNITNATLYLYNRSGGIYRTNSTTFTVSSFQTSAFNMAGLNLGTYEWNVLGCSNNSLGSVACRFATFNRSVTIGSFIEEFEQNITEGQSTGINLNITIDGVNQNILSLLTWNNTVSVPSKFIINATRVRFTSNFIVPAGVGNATGRSVSHSWRFYLPDGSLNETTTSQTQNVFSLGFDNCTSFTKRLLNFTLYDEDALTIIASGSAGNGSIEVDLTATSLANTTQEINFSRTYSPSNNAQICVSELASGFKIDAQVRYTANNYVIEFYNLQNASLSSSSFPQNISLFPLLSSRSKEFLVTFKDSTFAPVNDALVTVTRKYVGEGIFRTVEAPLTNNDGQALTHLVLGDIIYTVIVSKNGRILGTFNNLVPFCTNVATGDCTINLNAFSTGTPPSDFRTNRNLTYTFEFDKSARTITSIFSTTD